VKDLVYGWEPEEEVPAWLDLEVTIEPLVREYGFPREYWLRQEPRVVEIWNEMMLWRNKRKQAEMMRNASR